MDIEKKDPRWYAVYTAPRAEKKVRERFLQSGIEHYLPVQIVTRKWHDRLKKVEQPVLSGYIFVRIVPQEAKQVLMTYGAIAFVREQSHPAPIPDEQIERLRKMVEQSDEEVEFSSSDLAPGTPVRITRGELSGLIGELVETKGKFKVAIRLSGLGCALTTVSTSCLEKL
ncbi:UpxY family transcription antiterminator [uncultured Bacteroides sp.]|jgi:Transcription antiterminator|uniref:UpxY family transcription antiterminator n=1 Tax=uncultured Bacteroides sp. TaxID=162156 RepID=UPI002AABB07C|nr:UpxY family transcription antiterminator [uncultured Bacteroides sp.]